MEGGNGSSKEGRSEGCRSSRFFLSVDCDSHSSARQTRRFTTGNARRQRRFEGRHRRAAKVASRVQYATSRLQLADTAAACATARGVRKGEWS